MSRTIDKILVLGASGDQGLPLVGALKEAGATPIAGARRLDAMQDTVFSDLPVLLADITDQASLEIQYRNVNKVPTIWPVAHAIELA